MAKVHDGLGRIYLVGTMGCGKTTVGKALAAKLQREFVDLDAAIEARTHSTIAKIFDNHGDFNFRACEAQILRDLPRRYPQAVIATGGGTPMHFDNMKFIKETGLSIFLDIDAKHLVERLADQRAQRPLLNRDDWESYLEELTQQRRPVYEEAEVIVEVAEGDSQLAVEQIYQSLPQVLGH